MEGGGKMPKLRDITTTEFPEVLKPLRFHGAFDRNGPYLLSGRDYVGDCPFCGKHRSLVANGDTGQWVCHSKPEECGRTGNASTFLASFAIECHKSTSEQAWTKLSRYRKGVPVSAFRRWEVGYDAAMGRYIVPVKNAGGHIADLRVYNPRTKKKMGTAGQPAGCFNLNVAANCQSFKDTTLYIAEGEWDAMALDWLLRRVDPDFDFVVVGVPGARTVKTEWIDIFKRFGRVVVMGDNDGDGDAMSEKVWSKLTADGFKGELRFLNWPETAPDKHDLTDQIAAGIDEGVNARRIWKSIVKLISSEHRRMPFKGQETAEVAKGRKRTTTDRPEENPTFAETVAEYQKHLEITTHHNLALQFCFSVYLATQWDGDPLWGFVCGVPGSGKTELLCSMDGAPEAIYYSSLQAKALVSGFKFDPDPSLIPEMIGRCSIFKDFTELLSGNQLALEDTYAVLRGWYDGHVKRKFGNGVEREYFGRGNMLAGVTNVIHGQNDSSLGERFIKFQLPKPKTSVARKIVMSAMLNTAQEEKKNNDIKKAATAFLNRTVPKSVPAEVIPEDFMERIYALSNLVSLMRAKVEYNGFGFDRELSHTPEAELPTRLGKQLVKMAMANAIVLDKPKVDEESFRLVERVAFNTAHGFHLDIVEALMRMNGGRNTETEDIAENHRMPVTTLRRRLEDLCLLGIVNKQLFRTGKSGRPTARYSVAPSVRRTWNNAQVKDSHIEEAEAARVKTIDDQD